jgi:hypothetical protein
MHCEKRNTAYSRMLLQFGTFHITRLNYLQHLNLWGIFQTQKNLSNFQGMHKVINIPSMEG